MKEYKRILKVERLSKIYGSDTGKTVALRSITFDVLDGEFLGIMGASGSGKTTLLNCLATITKPSKGSIYFDGENILEYKEKDLALYRGRSISYIFQNFELLDNLTGRENIMMPLILHKKKINQEKIEDLAQKFDIKKVLDKFPTEMSGGEKQRVAAVRALIVDPRIILADEPTGSLDSVNSKILLEKLDQINKEEGKTILMVTHDTRAASFASRIILIKDGRIGHEIRRREDESQNDYYQRINLVTNQLSSSRNFLF